MLAFGALLQDMIPLKAGVPNMVFFHEISSFIDDELINEYLPNLGARVMRVVGGLGLTLLTLWIIVQGYRVITGQSRESMMALVVSSLRATFIVGIALGTAVSWGPTYQTLTEGLTRTVNDTMTGREDGGNAYQRIDRTLAIMQVALTVIDTVDGQHDEVTQKQKDRALWMTGVGFAGPAVTAASAILLNKIAIGLILALGPIFILCLLFEQTKSLFQRWLFYGIGALFSMALLNVMVMLALDMVIAVGGAFWVSSAIIGSSNESATSMAMQQGGLGLILSTLIVSAPPMAAMLFQGTLGQFSPYSAFSQQQQPGAPGQPGHPGAGGYQYTPAPAASGSMGSQAAGASPNNVGRYR
ncbi:type IV secretion system protein [Luteimonas aestuarii]|uniref:Type IV secretion system protein n=1 Tax=Luteimonas aestuarii TaxID=453837 RepID=A0A4R5TS65_9GAMM|nr:type IV secretion system protein [Luteimonas aestuarii]TDK22675.1 type IV secretion system protein [Luteimonas aestuarii]